jgi:UDP-N-acetylmuramoyl-tripeptide--D-alanyl-D-alanine ligase
MRALKNIGKKLVVAMLGWQLGRLQARHAVKTVAVAGSYGKTSTKFGIAEVLGQHFRVRFQAGNYNDLVTVPLIFFGQTMPSLLNPLAWVRVFLRNERHIRGRYPYDVVIVELGTDGPGQIAVFSRYLKVDITVLTAISHEHIEFFKTLEAVAHEELAIQQYSKQVLFNADLCAAQYTNGLDPSATSFGHDKSADYQLSNVKHEDNTHAFRLTHGSKTLLSASYQGASKMQVYSACAAAIIGLEWGMPAKKIIQGIAAMQPVSGRMQSLKGIRGSTILDETYNASPAAMKSALDVLYARRAPQKIALLGDMNELGPFSKEAHIEIGKYCDPKQVDLLLTLGPDANTYLAPQAKANGCTVYQFTTPYQAGEFLRQHIKEGAVVLAKGSQNKVFAEEAVKFILANPADATRLVRQSSAWIKKKAASFKA